jgi:peptidoglycan/LPS O-acetylase OafA/YrhL
MKANNFNLIRMLAAAAVIVSHSYPLRGEIWDPLQYVMNGVPLGQMAVDTFFVISGYLICQSWILDPNPVRFMERRALRLMPALAVVLLLSVFVIGPVFTTLPLADYFRSPVTWDYLRGLGVVWLAPSLPGVFPAGAYPFAFNGPLWTIRIEAACYLLLFIAGMAGVLRSRYLTLATFLVLTYFRFHLAHHPERYGHLIVLNMGVPVMVELASIFFAGATFFLWRDSIPMKPGLALVLGLSLVPLAYHPAFWYVFQFVFPYAVLCLALTPAGALSRYGAWGDFSYGTYLIGWPVQQALLNTAGASLPMVWYILSALAITIALSAILWHTVEKKALALKPRRPRNSVNTPRVSDVQTT